ncbi:hypothetical protein K431DRAFT_298946 [Polychaeton citri CBS 116435]|uniref:Uncharacterized protein n=1 Tax=Polychaeton citri CBS 116435 TaxID=1314669 RepID=A0A9P4PXY6_9PEZI|nr:hypothetical protein K431DRAFT_298946 [Polychaeton citri CBS 116435]
MFDFKHIIPTENGKKDIGSSRMVRGSMDMSLEKDTGDISRVSRQYSEAPEPDGTVGDEGMSTLVLDNIDRRSSVIGNDLEDIMDEILEGFSDGGREDARKNSEMPKILKLLHNYPIPEQLSATQLVPCGHEGQEQWHIAPLRLSLKLLRTSQSSPAVAHASSPCNGSKPPPLPGKNIAARMRIDCRLIESLVENARVVTLLRYYATLQTAVKSLHRPSIWQAILNLAHLGLDLKESNDAHMHSLVEVIAKGSDRDSTNTGSP